MTKGKNQIELEAYLAMKDLDIEVDMMTCGNLEMACATTLKRILAYKNEPLPRCMRIVKRTNN